VTLTELVPFAAQGGGLAAVAWVFALLHRSAIRAHDQRADDWRTAAELERQRADETSRQLLELLGAVKAGVS
jgi:hypothetical protein